MCYKKNAHDAMHLPRSLMSPQSVFDDTQEGTGLVSRSFPPSRLFISLQYVSQCVADCLAGPAQVH